ncbi:MAG: hypothetical protein ACI4RO_06050, partial [Candidatus Scatosoma sp.]
VIMRGWNTAEISVNGIELDFTYDAGTDTYSGTARLKIARIGDRLYIYDKYGVEKVILGGENSIELVNGASFDSDKTIPDGVKTAIATYFANTSAQGSETAIGLWCDNNNGCAEYKIAFNGKAVTV